MDVRLHSNTDNNKYSLDPMQVAICNAMQVPPPTLWPAASKAGQVDTQTGQVINDRALWSMFDELWLPAGDIRFVDGLASYPPDESFMKRL